MFAIACPRRSQRQRLPVIISLALLIAGLVCVPLAYAKLAGNTVDPIASVSTNGRVITVTGPLATDQTQPVFMRVTVTQRSTGAIAEGYAQVIGTVAVQQWTMNVQAVGFKSFEPGPATVVALAQSRTSFFNPDDAHQWLVNVTLVEN